jgi:hypothetical protein
MIRLTPLLAALLVVLPAGVFADEYPARKPGLWEITMIRKGAPASVIKLCLDAATERDSIKKGEAAKASICSRDEVHRSGNVYTSDSVCRPTASETTTHSVTTFISDTSYTVAITSHSNPPFMGHADQEMTQEGKWLGPCGTDMKPGDMVVGGRKMHAGGTP